MQQVRRGGVVAAAAAASGKAAYTAAGVTSQGSWMVGRRLQQRLQRQCAGWLIYGVTAAAGEAACQGGPVAAGEAAC
eukprot:1161298-Pelagomonas_calceolata.AAC.18